MKDDRQLIAELRSQLDSLAQQAPLANPHGPIQTGPTSHLAYQTTRRHRRVAVVAAVAAATLVGAVIAEETGKPRTTVVTGPAGTVASSTAPSSPPATGTPSVSPQITPVLPDVLPGPAATLLEISDYRDTAPTGQGSTGRIFAQDFEGPAIASADRVVVTTEIAGPGALAGYSRPPSRQITVHGGPGYLDTFPTHLQLLWQTAGGVVVSLEAINVDPAALEAMAAQLTVVAGEPGVTVRGTLPDGLAEGGRGYVDNDGLIGAGTSDISVGYRQDGCNAVLDIVAGQFADADAIAISAGDGRTISVNGHRAVEITWPVDQSAMTTVIWTYQAGAVGLPGVLARLQGTCTNIPALAAQLHTVTPHTWTDTVHSLGKRATITTSRRTPNTPTTTAPQPAGPVTETFGIAH